jgi:hypothetical protein
MAQRQFGVPVREVRKELCDAPAEAHSESLLRALNRCCSIRAASRQEAAREVKSYDEENAHGYR